MSRPPNKWNMEPAGAFDVFSVTPSRFTNAGRWVIRRGHADASAKGDIPYDECLALNPNHTPDVILKKASHLVYDGGHWKVPMEELGDFNRLRGTDVDQQKWNSITTQRTIHGPWFADIDPKFLASMTRPERTSFLFSFAKTIQKVFGEVFPEVAATTKREVFQMIATSVRDDPEPTETEEGESYIKMGTHLHAPNVTVTSHESRLIREAVLSLMKEAGLGTGILMNTLEDVYDEAVYIKAGLRPVFAPKFTKCKNAKRGTTCHCGSCDGAAGGFYEKPPHQLLFCIDGMGDRDEAMEISLESNKTKLIEMTEIRSDATEVSPAFFLPAGYPKYGINSVKKSCGKAGETKFRFREDVSLMRGTKVFMDVETDRRMEIISALVRGFSTSGLYSRVEISRVFSDAHTNFFVVGVDGFGSHYCSNLKAPKREHNKNTVYFVISSSGVVQKCHCKCKTVANRANGPCNDYVSPRVPLSRKQRLVLFPTAEEEVVDDTKTVEKKIGIGDMVKRFRLDSRGKERLEKMERMAYHMRRIRARLDQSAASNMSLDERVAAYEKSKH